MTANRRTWQSHSEGSLEAESHKDNRTAVARCYTNDGTAPYSCTIPAPEAVGVATKDQNAATNSDSWG